MLVAVVLTPAFVALFLPLCDSVSASRDIKTYGMAERANHLDFDIREQLVRPPLLRPHRHDYFQIQVSLQGDGEQTVGASVRPFGRGTLSFVLPYRVHVVSHPEGSRYVILNFSQAFLRPDLQADPLDLEDVPLSLAPELGPFLFQEYTDFAFGPGAFAEVEALVQRMLRENAQRRHGSLTLLRGLLLQLLGLTCQVFEADLARLAAQHAQKTSQREALQRVARFIRDHLAEDLTLADAAAAAFLSPNYLANLLKKETGKTFTELLTERRMERAQELLAHTSQRVMQVAHAVGFADESYFTRRFRQSMGLSPRAWRDQLRQRLQHPA